MTVHVELYSDSAVRHATPILRNAGWSVMIHPGNEHILIVDGQSAGDPEAEIERLLDGEVSALIYTPERN